MTTVVYLHRRHWQTTSFAEHNATNLYAELHESLDKIIEVYQGAFKRIPAFKVQANEMIPDLAKHLTAEADWIELNKDAITNESEPVENLLDGLIADYRQTAFLLTMQ